MVEIKREGNKVFIIFYVSDLSEESQLFLRKTLTKYAFNLISRMPIGILEVEEWQVKKY